MATSEGNGNRSMRDIKAISLIGLAHGNSHFYQLVLPPLFPFMIHDFGVGYTELGAMMTVFFISSGLSQPVAGFVVDKVGARRILLLGMTLYSAAILLTGLLGQFWMFFPVAVLIGIGNSVFHPADYTILSATVSSDRLGRAFSIHTFVGNLGWAAAPVFMLTAQAVVGWRGALLCAGAVGVAITLILFFNRHLLREEKEHQGEAQAAAAQPATALAPLISAPILLCFMYFLLTAAALVGLQNFLPTTLHSLHHTPLGAANSALTGFLLSAAIGILLGGVLADRNIRHGLIILVGMLGASVLFALVGLTDAMSATGLLVVISAAGFLFGVTTPSRDMLVRSATPKGATGRVFGFVYAGLDAGAASAPIILGIMLDGGQPVYVIWFAAAAMFFAIFTAVSVRSRQPLPEGETVRA